MKRIAIRRATEADKPQFLQWLARIADKNLIDPDVLTYPATTVLCAYDTESGKPLLFVPIQSVFMVESLAPSPEITELEMAKSLEKLIDVLVWESRNGGRGEIYYPCADETVIAIGERHGFKRVGHPVLKAKLCR